MAKLMRGDTSGSADTEAAKSLKPNIAEIFAKSGVPDAIRAQERKVAPAPVENKPAAVENKPAETKAE